MTEKSGSLSVLLIYQPWTSFDNSLHGFLLNGLKSLGLSVDYLDIENPPKFKNNYIPDKIRNIFERKFKNNKQYIYIAENRHYNRYFTKKLVDLIDSGKTYDWVIIIKPEEFSTDFIKKTSQIGNKTVGYIWDGLRLFFKPQLSKSRSYLYNLYSFDKNNIKEYPELKMKFLTNFFIKNENIVPFERRETDVFYVGGLAGTLTSQRRDYKLQKLIDNLSGKFDIKILVDEDFVKNSNNLLNDNRIQYITRHISLDQNAERTRNSKIVVDICKKHHIGLSFRFFDCLCYETKLITNNHDVINYDFYHPNNILVVDYDNIEQYATLIRNFQKIPYHTISDEIVKKYSIHNWFKKIISN